MSICKILIGWLVLFVALLISDEAYAGPVLKADVVLEQADGSKFIARPYGDEWNNGHETEDGYTILFDEKTGNWSYADRAVNGSLITTNTIVNKDIPPGPKYLRPIPLERPANTFFQGNFILEGPARPATGNQRVLVLLVQFANRTLMTTETDWANLIFGTVFSTVKHYYKEVSYNNLDLIPASESYGTTNDGIVVVTLPSNHPNTGGSTGDTNRQIARNALIASDPYVNFSAFDDDDNGYISSDELHIVVVVAGYETSYGTCSPKVWAHQWSLGGTVSAPTLDGKIVASSTGNGGYTQQGEWHCSTYDNPGHMATIGVIVHELGHSLWLPDEYDTDYSSGGIGDWGLMGSGSWNSCSGGYSGNCPSHPTAWDKSYLGWLTPTQIIGTQTVNIPDVTTNPTIFQLRDNPGGVDWSSEVASGTGEYFLVENRQRTGYNAGLPGSGLLIWHIWEGASSENDTNQNEAGRRLIDLREADGLDHLDLGTNSGDAGDPFPGISNNTVFDATSNPSSNLYCHSGTGFCQPSGVSVTGISASGPTTTATMAVGTACTYSISPTSQSFTASGGTGSVSVTTQSGCSWTAVSNASWITITSNSSGTGSGTVNYSVAASTSTSPRTGTMTIASRTFTVSQDGVETAILNGVPQSGSFTGSSTQSTWVYYYVDLPSGAANLVIDLYNLSADADLYVRRGSKPTLSTYDCRPWKSGTTNEQCSFSTPSSGKWWVGVNNYATGTISYTIKATWSGGESTISRSPASLSNSCQQGQNASSQSFEVWNSGGGTLSYNISDDATWLSCTPASGSSTGEHDTITVTYSTSALTAGNYSATISISASGATNSPQTIQVTLTVSSLCTPPSIITHPQSQTIQSGQTATLSVTASGTSPLTYQWYRGTSGDTSNLISGATSSSYTTPALTQTTSYWVRVSNSCGYANSNTATITMTTISFVTNTDSVTVPEGGTATFQVKLSAQPSSTVYASVSRVSGGDSDISVQSGSSLTFTTSNWSTYQTVTLSAAEDADITDGTVTIRISASGLPNKDITAAESDNDTRDTTSPTPPKNLRIIGAGNIRLSWDPNTELDLAGYRVYFGTVSQTYLTSIDVENVTTYTLTALAPGQSYYIAVTAYDTSNNESGYSNEVHSGLISKNPLNDTTEFVKQQYHDFLNREADTVGLQYWVNMIDSGAMTRAQVIESFFWSEEFGVRIAPIVRLYFAYFLRIPDYGGLLYWIDQSINGQSLESISGVFAASSEFQQTYGSLNNDQFVTLVYQNVLGRSPDPGGYGYWVGELSSWRRTRGQVMLEFSESAEYEANSSNEVFVTMIYVGMLRRSPEQGGFDYWVGYLDAGNSEVALIDGLLSSQEYANRF